VVSCAILLFVLGRVLGEDLTALPGIGLEGGGSCGMRRVKISWEEGRNPSRGRIFGSVTIDGATFLSTEEKSDSAPSWLASLILHGVTVGTAKL